MKTILTPRWYAVARLGYQRFNQVEDLVAGGKSHLLPNKHAHEFALGFRPNRLQLIKAGYLWLLTNPKIGASDNVLGVQLVTSVPGLTKPLR